MKKGILTTAIILLSTPALSYAQERVYDITPPPSYEKNKAEKIEKEKMIKEEKERQNLAKEKSIREKEKANIAREKLIREEKERVKLAEEKREKERLWIKQKEKEDVAKEKQFKKAESIKEKKAEAAQIKKEIGEKVSVKETKDVEDLSIKQKDVYSIFKGHKGDMLSKTLTNWAEQEGWQLHWSHDKDYRLPVNINTTGKVEDVFQKVGGSLLSQGIDISIKLYRANKVIVIK